MAVELSKEQLEAINNLQNGSILCGGVGSGKSITALGYYMFKACIGDVPVYEDGVLYPFYHEVYDKMKKPRDLYIITTAKKRDSLEWDKECSKYLLYNDRELSHSGVKVTIDSWNNIKKYKDITSAFFIFDEQRVVGSGAWVKAFLNITRKNKWILLSATPGDTWTDYIPVFVANGFYQNKTEFTNTHCVYSRFSKYPKIEKYIGVKHLENLRDKILVDLKYKPVTVRHAIYIEPKYDLLKYRMVMRDRWNPFDDEPIKESGKWCYLLRRVVNSDESRIEEIDNILKNHNKVIIFYNFIYELEILTNYLDSKKYQYAQWNGQKHEEVPEGDQWVYLVQYSSGCEGWECITTDTIIFYSLNYSYRVMEQSCGRIDRRNTSYTHLYYYILKSSAMIDLAINRALINKKTFNESSFNYFDDSPKNHTL